MNIQRAYKTELAPNKTQKTLLAKACGVSRFAYNWGLAWMENVYVYNQLPHLTLRTPTAVDLNRELNRMKAERFPWMYDVSKCAPQEALWDLQTAYSRFWRGLSSHPTFKSKRRSPKSFRVAGTVRVCHNFVKIPRLGRVRLKEKRYIPESVHVNSSTISERAGRWFVSIQGEEERSVPYNGGPLVGVDLGINSLATLSDGTKIENPKSLKRFERKLARLQKSASRKMLGSGNRRKANRRVSKCHYRIACIRKDAINKFTTTLARTKSVVVLENLQVSKMVEEPQPGEVPFGCELRRGPP